jgi:hypothetical protein
LADVHSQTQDASTRAAVSHAFEIKDEPCPAVPVVGEVIGL